MRVEFMTNEFLDVLLYLGAKFLIVANQQLQQLPNESEQEKSKKMFLPKKRAKFTE